MEQDPFINSSSRPRPGAHPESSFERLRAQRRYSPERAAGINNIGARVVSPISPPRPPPHQRGAWSQQRQRPQSNITPGADNFSEAAAGGMAGIALTVAEHNARESGLDAVQGPNYPEQTYHQSAQRETQGQGYSENGVRGPSDYQQPRPPYSNGYSGEGSPSASPQNSMQGLNAAPYYPGSASPGQRTPARSPHAFANEVYTDDPYQSNRPWQDPGLGAVNPHDIEDDGDDGLVYGRRGPRTSMLSLGASSNRSREGPAAAGAGIAAGAAAAGLAGRNGASSQLGGYYAPIHKATAVTGSPQGSTYAHDLGQGGRGAEKGNWGAVTSTDKGRKWRLAIIIGIGALIAIAIVLGIVFGVVLKNKGGSDSGSPAGGSAADDLAQNGDLNLNSGEIKALMNNPNLHKVFPGIDYTPLNAQYPDCMHHGISQNNVTRDVAVLSQMTNTIRLYGTDCNQTQMLIHSIRQLRLENTVKIWLGVWQDGNATTNARQLNQMWDILDEYGADLFKGVIVANEILFREEMTLSTLGNLLSDVRKNLTARGMDLPVATSDLGDDWTPELAAQSDYIMANIHPFFAGVPASEAANWTLTFWKGQNGHMWKTEKHKNIISETGWPSQGGMHCGQNVDKVDCPDQSVAGIKELNQFMEDWVCKALEEKTEYFWFEAFDEPWKIRFNTKHQNWEDHWGLMDVNRNLKPGVKIPDCGGKTI